MLVTYHYLQDRDSPTYKKRQHQNQRTLPETEEVVLQAGEVQSYLHNKLRRDFQIIFELVHFHHQILNLFTE